MEELTEKNWYAMSATFRRELKIKQILEEQNIECFVPMRILESKSGRRTEQKIAPAIDNLIFVYTDKPTLTQIKVKHQYLQYKTHYVDSKRIPIIVPNEQMERFIAFVNDNYQKVKYIDDKDVDFSTGERVRIVNGDFTGKEGILVKVKGKRSKKVVVAIEGVIAVMLMEVETNEIEKIVWLIA